MDRGEIKSKTLEIDDVLANHVSYDGRNNFAHAIEVAARNYDL